MNVRREKVKYAPDLYNMRLFIDKFVMIDVVISLARNKEGEQ